MDKSKSLEMNTKVTEKNLKVLADGKIGIDTDFGISTPSMLTQQPCKSGPGVKTEFPSLDILSNLVKANKTTHLISINHA